MSTVFAVILALFVVACGGSATSVDDPFVAAPAPADDAGAPAPEAKPAPAPSSKPAPPAADDAGAPAPAPPSPPAPAPAPSDDASAPAEDAGPPSPLSLTAGLQLGDTWTMRHELLVTSSGEIACYACGERVPSGGLLAFLIWLELDDCPTAPTAPESAVRLVEAVEHDDESEHRKSADQRR